jgi:hypothetical protein
MVPTLDLTIKQQAAILLGSLGSILVRWLTGKTPVHWLAMLLLVVEALLQQLFKSVWLFISDFVGSYRGTLREVKRGVAAAELVVMPSYAQAPAEHNGAEGETIEEEVG